MPEYSNAILSDTPLVYYRLDEQLGSVATDSSGNGYDATLIGSLTYGQVGAINDDSDTAILFSSNGGVLLLPPSVNAASLSIRSVEFWIKFLTGYQHLVLTYDGTTMLTYLNGSIHTTDVIGSDTFARANQSGWGTASDGETWIASGGTLSLTSNEGVATGNFGNDSFVRLGTQVAEDQEVLVRVAVTNVSNQFAGVALRYADANNTYFAYFNLSHLWIARYVSGSFSNLVVANLTQTSGQFYWLRFRAHGTMLSAKLWQDGTSEPSNWTLTTTDTSFVNGGFGLYSSASASGDLAQFDHFTASLVGSLVIAQDFSYVGASTSSTLDEVILYNQILAPAQVAWHYQIGISGRSGIMMLPATTRRTMGFSATTRRGI